MRSPILTFWGSCHFLQGAEGRTLAFLNTQRRENPKKRSITVLSTLRSLQSTGLILMHSWGCRSLWSSPVHKDHIPCTGCSLSSSLAVEGRSWRQDSGDAAVPCMPGSSDGKGASESEDLLERRSNIKMPPTKKSQCQTSLFSLKM